MIRVLASCPDCGEVRLNRDQIELVISNEPHASRYSFVCPRCAAWVSKPARPPLVRELDGAVVTRRETRPRELDEPRTGPALTEDGLIRLGLELAETDELARFAHR